MKKILSLLMALVLATGVCLCISSCEEAEDTSSPDKSAGYDIIAKTALKDAWDKYVYGTNTQTIFAQFGKEEFRAAAIGYSEEHFINSKDEIAEIKNILKEFESHIVKELTKDEVKEIDEQRRIASPEDYYLNLANLTMFDGVPEIVNKFEIQPATLDSISIRINEDYLVVSGAAFKLEGNVSEITKRIKDIRDR